MDRLFEAGDLISFENVECAMIYYVPNFGPVTPEQQKERISAAVTWLDVNNNLQFAVTPLLSKCQRVTPNHMQFESMKRLFAIQSTWMDNLDYVEMLYKLNEQYSAVS